MSRSLLLGLLLLAVAAGYAEATKKCDKPGYWCMGSHICIDRHLWQCPSDCFCGGGRCKPKEPKCKGDLRNYDCVDSTHFCLGGTSMRCAPGTYCGAHRGSGSPCYLTKRPKKCPRHHHWRCVDSRHVCLNGVRIKCLPGWRCHGWGPCVKPMW